MRLDGTTQPRKATQLKIGYLSAVDMPAHEGAQAIVLKARMLKEDKADMTPMIKSAFTDALREKQYEKAVEDALCRTWELQLNSALREAAEDIAKDPAIPDDMKPAALREAMNEYITVLHAAMLGTTVNKAAPTKTEGGVAYPASDFAYVPDATKPSEWKLRLTSTPGGEPDPAIVGAAAAAIGPGYRGNKVEIPEADRAAVVARVRAAWSKANPDKKPEDMPEGIRKQQEADMADEKELAKLRALAAMTDVQKAHHAKLDEQGQAEFEAFSAEERDAVVKALAVEDETFVAEDGTTVAKSKVGAELYAVMKNQNAQIAKLRDEADMTRLVKQAESELKHLPGEAVAKAKVLKSIERMPQAERDALTAMLKSGDAACAPGFKPVAAAGDGSGDGTAMGKIMQKSRAIADEKGITMAKAQEQFLNTPEGKELYAAHQKGE